MRPAQKRRKLAQHASVALERGFVQAADAHLIAVDCVCTEEKRRRRPVAFNLQHAAAMVAPPAQRKTARYARGDDAKARLRRERHLHIAGGNRCAAGRQPAAAGQERQRQQKPRQKLRRDPRRQRISARVKLAANAQRRRIRTGERAAAAHQRLCKRGQRPLRKPSPHAKTGVRTESAGHGQQKPQRACAFPAINFAVCGRALNRPDGNAVGRAFHGCAQRLQGAQRGFQIRAEVGKMDLARRV